MPIDDIDKMLEENKTKEFMQKYENLCKEYGRALNPTYRLGFEVIKLKKE